MKIFLFLLWVRQDAFNANVETRKIWRRTLKIGKHGELWRRVLRQDGTVLSRMCNWSDNKLKGGRKGGIKDGLTGNCFSWGS